MAAFNAFLTNSNAPLGTEFDDGLRIGPVLNRTVTSGSGANTITKPYSYQQWGQGLLISAKGTYNIIPRGPSGAGNIVGFETAAEPTGEGYLTLSADGYVTSSGVANTGSVFLQLDWPRVPQLSVIGGDLSSGTTITVFGKDCYGISLQASVVAEAEGDYDFLKAFYTITKVYWNGVAVPGDVTIQIQTTDTFGLPYRLKSSGDIDSIRWGNASDMSTTEEDVTSSNYIGWTTLNSTTGVTVSTPAVTKGSNIQVTRNTSAGTLGFISVPVASIIDNTSFLIDNSAADTSTVNWLITNPPYVSGRSGGLIDGADNMIAGVITIPSTNVNANSTIHANVRSFGTLHAAWEVSGIEPQVSFTMSSSADTETSTLEWAIMPQDWVSGVSANMVAGVVTVNTTAVQSNSIILVDYESISGTSGVLSVSSADIVEGESFVINSTSNVDTSTISWTIAQNVQDLTQGTGTLVAGQATITTSGVESSSVILLRYNTPGGATNGTWLDSTTITAGTSFVVQAKSNAGALVNTDVSTFNWVMFPNNMVIADFATPLGVFTPADDLTATAYTGDVRGTYKPSTPANGYNVLHFTSFYSGFDNFIDQQADAQLSAGGSSSTDLLTRSSITTDDQVGAMQYYTGTPA